MEVKIYINDEFVKQIDVDGIAEAIVEKVRSRTENTSNDDVMYAWGLYQFGQGEVEKRREEIAEIVNRKISAALENLSINEYTIANWLKSSEDDKDAEA